MVDGGDPGVVHGVDFAFDSHAQVIPVVDTQHMSLVKIKVGTLVLDISHMVPGDGEDHFLNRCVGIG